MDDGQPEVQTGIIKFYNPRKGYGFVTRSEGSDVFFHLTHFRTPTTPVPGNVVRFVLGQNREGHTAEDIVVVPFDTVECYGGTIVGLDADGGLVATPDNFEIRFQKADFIPHTRADAVKLGDEVEMNFLAQDDEGVWHARVVRSPEYDPDQQVGRPERRDGDEEEENRRLLGILYKTDLDEEAAHAAQVLAERNMRATLSALASRVFDRRLSAETRSGLVQRIPAIYFDDECQVYLAEMAEHLQAAVDEEDGERCPAAAEALRLLLDDQRFPLRWSQYLLPFGLTLLRNLSSIPSCHHLLGQPELIEAAETWLVRVCRHVEQRRSGHGYVMTTALATFDELWQREVLRAPVDRTIARLLVGVDAEGLANQIHHLRDKLSPAFVPVLLQPLSQHPDLPAALRSSAQSETFAQWVEMVVRSGGATLSTELLATILPMVEELRGHLADEAAIERLLRPVTDSLTPEEVVRMLTAEDLPERAVWACLRHFDRRGELAHLLGAPEVRQLVTDWLRRTSGEPAPTAAREQEVNTALHLIESLRGSTELGDELAGIGQNLFAGIHERLARAAPDELVRLLDQFDVGALPGLTEVLGRRLADEALPEPAAQRLLAYFDELGPPLGEAAGALAAWRRQPDEVTSLSEVITACESCRASRHAEAGALAEVLAEGLAAADVGWHDGLVTGLEELPAGRAARLQGFAILVPERLFRDPADFARHRYVRLLHRGGLALGVVGTAVATTEQVCGRLAGPLAIDERNAMVGTLIDGQGEACYFEVGQMISGLGRPLQEGDLLRFTRLPAPDDPDNRHIAFNVQAAFSEADLALLLDTAAGAADDDVAAAAARTAAGLATAEAAQAWRGWWAAAETAARERVLTGLDDATRVRVQALLDAQ